MLRFDRLVVSCVDHRHFGSAAEDSASKLSR